MPKKPPAGKKRLFGPKGGSTRQSTFVRGGAGQNKRRKNALGIYREKTLKKKQRENTLLGFYGRTGATKR